MKQYITIGPVGWTMFGSRLSGGSEWSTAGAYRAPGAKKIFIFVRIDCRCDKIEFLFLRS